MRYISRELFDIAEDFNLEINQNDGGIFFEGELDNFCGFLVDLSIRLSDSGNAQTAFDLAKSVDYATDETGDVYRIQFVGYLFS